MQTKLPKRYLTAFKGLYGPQLELGEAQVLQRKKRAPRARDCPDEDHEHLLSAAWLRKMGIPHHHSPNGEKREPHIGAKLKAMGTSAGFPDFVIPGYGQMNGKRYPILFIELKAMDGTVSGVQQAWLDLLNDCGYYSTVAYGFDEFKTIVQNYFKE